MIAADAPLILGPHRFTSRLFLGTGKYPSMESMVESLAASGTQCVTVAVRRLQQGVPQGRSLLDWLPRDKFVLLPNTAGCFDAEHAVRTARLGRELGIGDLVKLEVLGDPDTLLPDPLGTLEAAKVLVKEGFVVLCYTSDDPVLARRLEDVGVCAVMPAGAPIGSGQGILNPNNLRIILERAKVPVVVADQRRHRRRMSAAAEPLPVSALALRFLAGFVVLAVGQFVAWDLLVQVGAVPAAPTSSEHMEGSMLAWLLTAAAVGALAVWLRPAWPWRPLPLLRVVAAYVPFALVWALLLVVYLRLFAVDPQPTLGYLATGSPARPGFWIVVAGIVIAAPMAEEIVFRGYLQPALLRVLPRWPAIVATAAVFGLAHQLPYALPVSLLGIFFGWLVVRHQSLLPSIAAHAMHNGAVVLVTCLWPESLEVLYRR